MPVPDLPTFRDGEPNSDWRDILLAVDRAGPVLCWLDETVPVKQAPEYFEALQRFFHASNEITADTDHRILWSADHVLRVLDDVTRHPELRPHRRLHLPHIAALEETLHGTPIDAEAVGKHARAVRETLGVYLTERDLHELKNAGRR